MPDDIVYERGKPLKNREDLELLQFVLQDDTARSLKAIERSQQRENIQGRVDRKSLICTGSSQVFQLLKESPYTPWAAVDFYNGGPNTAIVSINNASDWNNIDPNSNLSMDFLRADKRIEVIYYKSDLNASAIVTATGKW